MCLRVDLLKDAVGPPFGKATSHSSSHDQWLHEVPWSSRGLMLFTVNDSRHSWIIMFLLREWEINPWEKIPGSSWVQSSLEGVRISWSLAEACRQAAYIACLLLLCQRFKWLNGESVWLVFRSWVRIPAGSRMDLFLTLSAKISLFNESQGRSCNHVKTSEGFRPWQTASCLALPESCCALHSCHYTNKLVPPSTHSALDIEVWYNTPWKLDAQKETYIIIVTLLSICANRWSHSIHPPSSNVVPCSVKVAGK